MIQMSAESGTPCHPEFDQILHRYTYDKQLKQTARLQNFPRTRISGGRYFQPWKCQFNGVMHPLDGIAVTKKNE